MRSLLVGWSLAATLMPAAAVAQAGHSLVTIHVSPDGDDRGDGSSARPLRTLVEAQIRVRKSNRDRDVTVLLHGGTYRLEKPLRFSAADGGQGGYRVTWRAAPGTRPTISGGIPVSGWKPYDADKYIFVADVPKGSAARQIYVDGIVAERPRVEVPWNAVRFTAEGMAIDAEEYQYLLKVAKPQDLEFEYTGNWSEKIGPVAGVSGNILRIEPQAWRNIVLNYDGPLSGNVQHSQLLIRNGLELFNRSKEWTQNENKFYLDGAAGKLYFRPNENYDPKAMDVVLPRLEMLISIAGTLDKPVRNLSFEGLRFSHTTWLGPDGVQGYSNHQTASYIDNQPLDGVAFDSCVRGCATIEKKREAMKTIPAAIQVSAASGIVFDDDIFSQLGQIGLGIGNDAASIAAPVGLGASDVRVTRSRFVQLSGGAIIVGGIRPHAHHPSDPRMINRNILIADNHVTAVSRQYRDNAAIMSTYVDGMSIVHNELWELPYDAISIGWGWGINDAGGSDDVAARITTYQFNRRYDTPTVTRNVLVASNRIHDVSQYFLDGGAIYNLSATPGSEVRENYISGLGNAAAFHLDQGTRYLRIANNVVDGTGFFLKANTRSPVAFPYPYNIRMPNGLFLNFRTIENEAVGNWHSSNLLRGDFRPEVKNDIRDDTLVVDKDWPEAARAVMAKAGVRPRAAAE